ncbi:hypothetical protein AXF42_Ash004874 [Apostasia shenzhenica]|uniref:Uncharacterized protein n=1 Tax=Apostasia shenzhenica TaxID=1088818 RepID=A0A2I0B7U7_9ASPA|nr:hypothetical protein AXF42_Ash004874 [Apostasia shenzhenica]
MEDEGGGGEAQRAKRAAAAAYDYDGDPRWAEYWSNVLIPAHMASRSDVVDHYKRKFYHRFVLPTIHSLNAFEHYLFKLKLFQSTSLTYLCDEMSKSCSFCSVKDPDFVVEAMSSAGSSQSARVTARSSSTTREQARPQHSGISAASGRSTNSLRLDKHTIHFSVNAWVLIVAFLGILPLVPRNLSNKAFRLSLLGTALSSFYSLYNLYGKPRAWNLQALQMWFLSIIVTKDFMHGIYCLTFVSSRMHFKFALIPVVCWAIERVAKFLRSNFSRSLFYRRYLEQACLWVEANTTTLSILSSNAEVALGFLLIFSLISWQRNILQAFMYWQLLKLMYHAPATASFHRSVWAEIGRTANPYIYRYTPFLNTPISAIQRWWFR